MLSTLRRDGEHSSRQDPSRHHLGSYRSPIWFRVKRYHEGCAIPSLSKSQNWGNAMLMKHHNSLVCRCMSTATVLHIGTMRCCVSAMTTLSRCGATAVQSQGRELIKGILVLHIIILIQSHHHRCRTKMNQIRSRPTCHCINSITPGGQNK